jgi:hypothetical protein
MAVEVSDVDNSMVMAGGVTMANFPQAAQIFRKLPGIYAGRRLPPAHVLIGLALQSTFEHSLSEKNEKMSPSLRRGTERQRLVRIK